MSILAKQVMDMKPSENVWDAIEADLPPATNGTAVGLENLGYMDGKDNVVSEVNEDKGLGEMDPHLIVDLDGSQLPDSRHSDMLNERDQTGLSTASVPVSDHTPSIGKASQTQWVMKKEPDTENHSRSPPAIGMKSSLEVRAQLFSDSTDEDEDSGDGDKEQLDRQDALRKRRRSSERSVPESAGKKFKGYDGNDISAPSASTGYNLYTSAPPASTGFNPHAVKADWSESQGATLLIPPGLEKLHRVFTSLNTACGFLQNQQLDSSWPNVKQALQQLSGTNEVIPMEDIERLAQLCPTMVVLSKFKGDIEDASFHIELRDPSEPRNSEQHGMSGAADAQQKGPSDTTRGRQVSDTEARMIVERRQRAFQLALQQLGLQLQTLPGGADASEHNKHAPIHHAMQRHPANDGQQHPMGPAILALPTQNLVLTPPPLLPPQLQPSFIGISNSPYHGLPFPVQLQPTNAYAFAFPQPQADNYAGYQLSSIPSTSQPSPSPAHNGSQRAQQSTPPLVIDLTEPAETPDPSSFNQNQSLNKGKRKRSRNWETWEVMLLVQAKRNEWDRVDTASGRSESSNDRWKRVERYLKENKVADRDAAACKNKWESLLSDYKAVKDWNRKPGNSPYNTLTSGEKKASSLPPIFSSNLIDLLDTFQGKSAQVSPPSVVDSQGRSAPAVSGGAASGGDDSGAEDSGEAPPAPHDAYAGHEALGKRKSSGGGLSPLVAAIDRLTANMMSLEKGRDERSERLLALENRKYELDRNKFELQARKLEIEREDRKGLMRVLGNLAGAFHRMADKMNSEHP